MLDRLPLFVRPAVAATGFLLTGCGPLSDAEACLQDAADVTSEIRARMGELDDHGCLEIDFDGPSDTASIVCVLATDDGQFWFADMQVEPNGATFACGIDDTVTGIDCVETQGGECVAEIEVE